MKRVLVGVDASRNAEEAMRWAAGIAEPLGAEIVVVAAWMPQQVELPPQEFEREHRRLREAVDKVVAEHVGNVSRIEPHIIDGSAVDVLLEFADVEDADLLVLGLRGSGGFLGLRLGSVADEIAHRTLRPLALVPDEPPIGVRRIVLGVDGSEGASAAESWCAATAPNLDAEVTAVAVYTQQLEVLSESDPSSVYQYFNRSLNGEWIEALNTAGCRTRTELVREPHVAEALIDSARRCDGQMIVVGTHGFAPLTHLRLGGVAMRLLHTTSLPLVLVPPSGAPAGR